MQRSKTLKTTQKPSKTPYTASFEAIGTRWEIELYDDGLSKARVHALFESIAMRIEQFDADYSRFRADSWIARLSQGAGTYDMPTDAAPLFDLYEELYTVTGGKVTPLIGQILSDAGYDAGYSLKPGTLHAARPWHEVVEYAFPKLTVREPVLLDLGAAGKGYLVDVVSELIERAGIRSYVVDAGGDMRLRGDAPRAIGLEHPVTATQVIGVMQLRNASLCGSAVNRRAWAEYHHVMDPITLKPVRGIHAVWVLASSTMLADALTTCLFFMPAARLKRQYTFEYALIRDNYSLEYSPGFTADFFDI